MREISALFRAALLTETSYRMNMVMSLGSLVLMVVPLYFVSGALEPMMKSTIAPQSEQYFAFALLGTAIYTFVIACASALPNALASSIGRGTFEAFLGTPTRLPVLFAGMSAYGVAWAFLRGALMILVGIGLGAHVQLSGFPSLLIVLLLLVVSYGAIGLIACALLLRFRTTGPMLSGVFTASALLGGVYYPTHVIPSWLQQVSNLLPLTYGLRAARQAALLGEPLRLFSNDLLSLVVCATLLVPIGTAAVWAALRYGRRTGTLMQY